MNGMDHPVFIPQPQRITALWPVLISRPTNGKRLSWPGWLVTYRNGMPARRRSSIRVPFNRPIVWRHGIELTTIESHVRRPNHWTTETPRDGAMHVRAQGHFLLSFHTYLLPFYIYFLTDLLPYLFTSSRIGLFRFHRCGGPRRRPNLALIVLCCSRPIFCYGCMFAFVVWFIFFSTKLRDWLGRTSPKWPILCWLGRKTHSALCDCDKMLIACGRSCMQLTIRTEESDREPGGDWDKRHYKSRRLSVGLSSEWQYGLPRLPVWGEFCVRNKHICPRNTRTEMYAGRVVCCLLVSHAEYLPTAQSDGRTDGHETVTLRLPLDAASIITELLIQTRRLLAIRNKCWWNLKIPVITEYRIHCTEIR